MEGSKLSISFGLLLKLLGIVMVQSQMSPSSWLTTTPLPAPSMTPPLSLPLSFNVYASSQSICPFNNGGVTINNFCSVMTQPLSNPSVGSCYLITSFPSIPLSIANGGLAISFSNDWSLNFYSVNTSLSGLNGVISSSYCSSSNLVLTVPNPQWNSIFSCSNENITQWYQFGYQNGYGPVVNGSMLVDLSGLGYTNCPYGYFWPSQPSCPYQPSPLSPLTLSTPVNPSTSTSNPQPFQLSQCNTNNPYFNMRNSSYSMSLTVGLLNKCPSGCDGIDIRTCFQALDICLEDLAPTDYYSQCLCYNSGLPLCQYLTSKCGDPYAMYRMNSYYLSATSSCNNAQYNVAVNQNFMIPSTSSIGSCSTPIGFAVTLGLILGGLGFYWAYGKYKSRSLQAADESLKRGPDANVA